MINSSHYNDIKVNLTKTSSSQSLPTDVQAYLLDEGKHEHT